MHCNVGFEAGFVHRVPVSVDSSLHSPLQEVPFAIFTEVGVQHDDIVPANSAAARTPLKSAG